MGASDNPHDWKVVPPEYVREVHAGVHESIATCLRMMQEIFALRVFDSDITDTVPALLVMRVIEVKSATVWGAQLWGHLRILRNAEIIMHIPDIKIAVSKDGHVRHGKKDQMHIVEMTLDSELEDAVVERFKVLYSRL